MAPKQIGARGGDAEAGFPIPRVKSQRLLKNI